MPDGHVERFDLTKNSMTIGRSAEADITIDLPVISRLHARIDKHKGRWTITDLQSRNKVRVDNHSVKSHVLANHDTFFLGSIKVVFQDPDGGSDEKVDRTVPRRKPKAAAETGSQTALGDENTCPRCLTTMAPEAVVCVQCGYNTKTGKRLKLRVEDGPNEIGKGKTSRKPADEEEPPARKGLSDETRELILKRYLPIGVIALVMIIVALWAISKYQLF